MKTFIIYIGGYTSINRINVFEDNTVANIWLRETLARLGDPASSSPRKEEFFAVRGTELNLVEEVNLSIGSAKADRCTKCGAEKPELLNASRHTTCGRDKSECECDVCKC